jgi:hypothetical protein
MIETVEVTWQPQHHPTADLGPSGSQKIQTIAKLGISGGSVASGAVLRYPPRSESDQPMGCVGVAQGATIRPIDCDNFQIVNEKLAICFAR